MRARVLLLAVGVAVALMAVAFAAHHASSAAGPAHLAAEPDAVAFTAMADLERGRMVAARQRLRWLASRGPVWGLSYGWDAFQDGSVNPRSTVYSYTTAVVGLAFDEGYVLLHVHRYLEVARRSADVLVSRPLCCWRSSGGEGVWYSDQPADQQPGYHVYNVTGLTLALLGRLHTHRRLAAVLSRGLMGGRTSNGWPYMNGRQTPNDLVHATFIVLGVAAMGERTAARRELNRLWHRYLPGGSPTAGQETWGSNDWGPAAALWALAETHECRRARELAVRLDRVPGNPRGAAVFEMARAMYARRCG